MSLANLEVNIGANTKGFQYGIKQMKMGLKQAKSGVGGLTQSVSGLVKTGLGIAGVTLGIKSLTSGLKAFGGLESSMRRVVDLFGQSGRAIQSFAENSAKMFGMSETAAYEYAAVYGNLFRSITKNQNQNAAVTIEMLKTSAVVASKTGRTMQDVMERIRSGLLGNTEAIEDLGIHVNVAMLEMTDAFKQISNGRSWEKLTFYEQQQIRTLAILEQAHKNFGNEVQKGSAFALSSLSSAFKDLIAVAGAFVNHALQPIINALTEVVRWATAGLKTLAAMMGIEAKIDFSGASSGAQQLASGLEESTEAAKAAQRQLAGFDKFNDITASAGAGAGAAAAGGGADPFADFSVSLEDAKKEESKIEKWFQQFETWPERLFAIGKSIAESISKALGGINWNTIKETMRTIVASIAEFFNGFIATPEFWHEIGRTFSEGLNTIFEGLEEFAETFNWHDLGNMLSHGLNTAIEFWDAEKAGDAIYKTLNGIIDTVHTFFTETDWGKLGQKIAIGLNKIFDNLDWELLGRAFAGKWQALIDTLYKFVETFDWDKFGVSIGEAINGWFDEIDWAKAGETVSNGIVGALDTLGSALGKVNWKKIGDDIGEFLGGVNWTEISEKIAAIFADALFAVGDVIVGGLSRGFAKGLLDAFSWDGIAAGFSKAVAEKFNISPEGEAISRSLLEGFMKALNPVYWAADSIKYFQSFLDDVKKFFGIHSPSTVMYDVGSNLMQGLINGISSLVSSAVGLFSQMWQDVQSVWQPAAAWFDDNIIKPISEFFTKLWADVPVWASKAWESIKAAWSVATGWFEEKVLSPLKDGFKKTMNSLIVLVEGWVNGFIRGINFIIGALNKIQIELPDWAEKITGMSSFGINIPKVGEISLPRLAGGGIAYGEVQAVVGDNFNARQDPEVISPLSGLQKMITSAMLQRDITAGGDKEMRLILQLENGEILADMLIDPINKRAKTLGYAPVFKPIPTMG